MGLHAWGPAFNPRTHTVGRENRLPLLVTFVSGVTCAHTHAHKQIIKCNNILKRKWRTKITAERFKDKFSSLISYYSGYDKKNFKGKYFWCPQQIEPSPVKVTWSWIFFCYSVSVEITWVSLQLMTFLLCLPNTEIIGVLKKFMFILHKQYLSFFFFSTNTCA